MKLTVVLGCVAIFSSVLFAQTAVPVGKGSYADAPPAGKAQQFAESGHAFVLDPGDRPIPSNRSWSQLITKGKGADVWMYPMNVHVEADTVKLFYANSWGKDGKVITEQPLVISADGVKPDAVRVKDWSDWLVSFRAGDSDRYLDYTLGEGLPYVWIECKGTTPQIAFGDKPGAPTPTFFDKAGQPGDLPASGDCVGITFAGRSYAVFAPDQTKFNADGGKLTIEFAGDKQFLVVAAMPKPTDIATFYKYGFAIPRNSQVSWAYDPAAALVTTTWTLTTDLLKGTEHGLIQGWIPHHYRKTQHELKFAGIEYPTVRGTMKCATGTSFTIAYPFRGFLPLLPAPQKTGLANDFDPDRMKQYLQMGSEKTKYGDDTYWGAKNFLQMGHYMEMAQQLKDPSADTIRANMRKALVDWFTYTPGESAHFFARYERLKALVGFKSSFGSETFTDNHFHYGYFTISAATLGFADPQFLADYGPMAKLVAKQYANWDRNDKNFPTFRTMDLWAGHSWAGGSGSPGGNNQESSSEAVQSWTGLFLLGTALNDPDMISAGAMGYAMETSATMEYWYNQNGDVFPKSYEKPIAGMVWSGGQVYGTWFSGDPAWIFGIQWLPWNPSFSYLVEDPAFAKRLFTDMVDQRNKSKEKKKDIDTTGSGLGNVLMTFASQYDADYVAGKMDEYWASNNPIAKENDTGGMTYYWTHAKRTLGMQQFNYHMSVPTSAVYFNERTKTTSYVSYNPRPEVQTADVYKDGKKIGSITLPPNQLTTVTNLK